MRMTERRPYVVLAVGLAIAGLIATLLARKTIRDSLRERGRHNLKLLKERANKLRTAAEEVAKRTKDFVGPHHSAVETDTEGEERAYQEDKLNILGG